MIKLVCENLKAAKENDSRKSKWEAASYLETTRDASLKWTIVKIRETSEKSISLLLRIAQMACFLIKQKKLNRHTFICCSLKQKKKKGLRTEKTS